MRPHGFNVYGRDKRYWCRCVEDEREIRRSWQRAGWKGSDFRNLKDMHVEEWNRDVETPCPQEYQKD
eukprot:scaffold1307_cov200-Pinguiococcus_pyrenoidosus.AAC.132